MWICCFQAESDSEEAKKRKRKKEKKLKKEKKQKKHKKHKHKKARDEEVGTDSGWTLADKKRTSRRKSISSLATQFVNANFLIQASESGGEAEGGLEELEKTLREKALKSLQRNQSRGSPPSSD